jgi:hypothetical protein
MMMADKFLIFFIMTADLIPLLNDQMDHLVAIECSNEAVRVNVSCEDLSLKTDLGTMKTVSRHFLDPKKIVLVDSRSGRSRAINLKFWVMKASKNNFSTTYFVSDSCEVAFANFHKTWTKCFQLALQIFMNGTKVFWTLNKEIIEWTLLQTFLELDELAVKNLTKTG